MIRAILLTVASIAARILKPQSYQLGAFSLTASQFSVLQWYLKWALPLWAVVDVNSALNRLAENRWRWKNDKSRWIWNKEVAVVTGGSAGIGACVVKSLVSQGIKVAVLDVSPLEASFINDERKNIRYYKCDITSREDVHRAAEAVRSDLGPPSILINNAGIGQGFTILDIPTKNLRKMLDINLMSHWGTVQEFLPDMIANKKGHIMGVASVASFITLAGAVDYSCTKAALLAFHEGLTQELKHRYKCPEIMTTLVHPGWTKSAITADASVQAGLRSAGATLFEPQYIASAMVNQIKAVKSGQLILGPAFAPRLRALPLWFQELVRDSQANVINANN